MQQFSDENVFELHYLIIERKEDKSPVFLSVKSMICICSNISQEFKKKKIIIYSNNKLEKKIIPFRMYVYVSHVVVDSNKYF